MPVLLVDAHREIQSSTSLVISQALAAQTLFSPDYSCFYVDRARMFALNFEQVGTQAAEEDTEISPPQRSAHRRDSAPDRITAPTGV